MPVKKENKIILQHFKFHVPQCKDLNLGRGQNTPIEYRVGVLNIGCGQMAIKCYCI